MTVLTTVAETLSSSRFFAIFKLYSFNNLCLLGLVFGAKSILIGWVGKELECEPKIKNGKKLGKVLSFAAHILRESCILHILHCNQVT